MLKEEPEKNEDGKILSPIQPNKRTRKVPVKSEQGDYNIEDLLDVWRLSFHSGMIAKMVIDNNVEEGKCNEAVEKVLNDLFSKINNHGTLLEILSNRMMLLGLIADVLELKEVR